LRLEPSLCPHYASNAQVLNVIADWAFRPVIWTEITQLLEWECRAKPTMLNSLVRTALDKVAVHVV